MSYNPDKHHRQSTRLRDYDYSSSGAYFITICTFQREPLFGKIVDGCMQLNDLGCQAAACWRAITQHFPHVLLDEFVVMPNHVHGILIITDTPSAPTSNEKAQDRANNYSPVGTSRTIGSVVRGFKIGVTKWVRRSCPVGDSDIPVWQRNYYDRIIRNEAELMACREYIVNNPIKWDVDRNHPQNMINNP